MRHALPFVAARRPLLEVRNPSAGVDLTECELCSGVALFRHLSSRIPRFYIFVCHGRLVRSNRLDLHQTQHALCKPNCTPVLVAIDVFTHITEGVGTTEVRILEEFAQESAPLTVLDHEQAP